MASKTIEEFLKNASPEQRGALDKLSQDLQNQNVQSAPPAPTPTPSDQALTDRADVQQINQDWQQGKDVKIETVSGKSDLALADGQVPRDDPSKPGAYDQPKFMDEKGQQSPSNTPSAAEHTQQAQPGEQRDQPQAQTVDSPQQKPRNAVQEVLADDAKRDNQAKAPTQEKSQSQSASKSPEPER